MADLSDEILLIQGEKINPIYARPMKAGILGKTLEDALQNLFEHYPRIIPGKQIDPMSEDPPRFFLLRREMQVGAWFLDHLFVDQRGIITLLETKLFQNPESRREVIGQIIEYAANARQFWGDGIIRQKAAEFWSTKSPHRDIDQLLADAFGEDVDDIDAFWDLVESNLTEGRMRLVIAGDQLRPEIKRMIEFLNREMRRVEILGLEIKCYGGDTEPLVLLPRLYGQTQESIDKKKTATTKTRWTFRNLEEAYEQMTDTALGEKLKRILYWADKNGICDTTNSKLPIVRLLGKNNKPIIKFAYQGHIYAFINEKFFPGNSDDRDLLVNELKTMDLLDVDLDPEMVVDGRRLNKTIAEMNDAEIDRLLQFFKKYCAPT